MFLGSPSPSASIGKMAARIATDTARTSDQWRAIQYYEDLILNAAKGGAQDFLITREMYDAAPKDRAGAPIDIYVVGCWLADKLGYVVVDWRDRVVSVGNMQGQDLADDEEEEGAAVDPPDGGLLLVQGWTLRDGAGAGPSACTAHTLHNIDRIRQGLPVNTTPLSSEPRSLVLGMEKPSRDSLTDLERCFIDVIESACSNAHKALYDLARKAFSEGRLEFVVDDQVWTNVATQFPIAEKAPPLFRHDVRGLATQHDIRQQETLSVLVPSVARRLAFHTDGLLVVPTLPPDLDLNDVVQRRNRDNGALLPRLPLYLRPKLGALEPSSLCYTRFWM